MSNVAGVRPPVKRCLTGIPASFSSEAMNLTSPVKDCAGSIFERLRAISALRLPCRIKRRIDSGSPKASTGTRSNGRMPPT
jgi:hypothetical protein